MPLLAKRVLSASVLSAGVVAATLSPVAAHAVPGGAAGPSAQQPAQDVIVVLRNQHTDLSITKGQRSPRIDAAQRDQAPAMDSAKRAGMTNLRGFKTINGFAGKATPAQVAQLSADPAVQGVFPDLQITKGPKAGREAGPKAGGVKAAAASTDICPSDPAKPLLEPEALQVTNTAFNDATTPQAQNLATGAGVKVAWIADG